MFMHGEAVALAVMAILGWMARYIGVEECFYVNAVMS
jgi:hypothetical protein